MNKMINENKTYHIGIPAEPHSNSKTPKFKADRNLIIRNGKDLLFYNIQSPEDYFNADYEPLDNLEEGQIYQMWEATYNPKNGKTSYEKVYETTYKKGNHRAIEIEQDDYSLNDKIANAVREANPVDNTYFANLVTAKDRAIGDLYKELSNIHEKYRAELIAKDQEINLAKTEAEKIKIEFESFKNKLEEEKRVKAEFEAMLEKQRHEQQGRINALEDQVKANEGGSILDVLNDYGLLEVAKSKLPDIIDFTLKSLSPQNVPVESKPQYNPAFVTDEGKLEFSSSDYKPMDVEL